MGIDKIIQGLNLKLIIQNLKSKYYANQFFQTDSQTQS